MNLVLTLAQWFACLAIPCCMAVGRLDWMVASVCMWDLCRQRRADEEAL